MSTFQDVIKTKLSRINSFLVSSKMLRVKMELQHLKRPPSLAHNLANFVLSCKKHHLTKNVEAKPFNGSTYTWHQNCNNGLYQLRTSPPTSHRVKSGLIKAIPHYPPCERESICSLPSLLWVSYKPSQHFWVDPVVEVNVKLELVNLVIHLLI